MSSFLIWHKNMFLRFIYVVRMNNCSFLVQCSGAQTYCSSVLFFNPLTSGRTLDCFPIWAGRNNVAVNMCMGVFLLDTFPFLLDLILTEGLLCHAKFNFLKELPHCQTKRFCHFASDQHRQVQVSSRSHQYRVLVLFWTMTILVNMK